MKIIDKILNQGEYYTDVCPKNTIYLHHTAGGHNPVYAMDGWNHDKTKAGGQLKVATAYLIGGISTYDKDISFDGIIYRAFDDKYWAHHLGTHLLINESLNKQSIAIEICNYGPLTKNSAGQFINYIGKQVPPQMVTTLDKPFRGFIHFHKYTDKQLIALEELVRFLGDKYKINLKAGLQQFINSGASAFEINAAAQKGLSGVWSHTNVIDQGKWDLYPCPRIIEMIKRF